ncbi:MAG: LemA family protein [Bacteroidales bacterium]|nr:LemA family protein [Bacteroidales bacterium]MBD5351915.1 LemA family protein [Bacteroides sp.]MDE6032678.1 LemA family protein [Muribaculaceae bacterium]MBD5359373.1 LemA family protein [Bacteroides sp.]MBD5361842.1 LemA family protein [Bacteroides sp.]
MANLLDEMTGPVNDQGQDVRVINRQIPVTVGFGSTLFEIALWVTIPLLVLIFALVGNVENPGMVILIGCILGILPGVIFIFMKINAKNYFQQLEQKIQAEASNIDNYLEQRVQILQNVVGLVNRAVELDSTVMTAVAALRSGGSVNESNRNEVVEQVNTAFGRLFPQVEAYPELKAHNAIADAMQQNNYLQREITAARTVYNSRVTQWNTDIFSWPTKMIVAAKQGYTTRIPFTISNETREMARAKFF